MPLPKGTRFAVKTTKTGKKIRLAFQGGRRGQGGKVIEAKNLKTGATHTSAEFAAPRGKPKKLSGQAKRMR